MCIGTLRAQERIHKSQQAKQGELSKLASRKVLRKRAGADPHLTKV